MPMDDGLRTTQEAATSIIDRRRVGEPAGGRIEGMSSLLWVPLQHSSPPCLRYAPYPHTLLVVQLATAT